MSGTLDHFHNNAPSNQTGKQSLVFFLPLSLFKTDMMSQGLLDLDGRNSQKYLHQTWADF